VTEPDLGPVPVVDPDLRTPELFVPAQPYDAEEAGSAEPEQPEAAAVTELTDEERLLFSQLLTVGQRSKTIDVAGHTVMIQSLRVSDDLRIGLYCKPYEGSKMEHRAFQLGACAAGIRAIDDRPLHQPLTPTEGEDQAFQAKVKTLEHYYPVVITEIYREIMALDQEFVELAMKLGKLKG